MKKISLGLISIIFILVLSACGGTSGSAYNAGLDALGQKDLDLATKEFEKSVDEEEEDADKAAKYLDKIDLASSISASISDESYDEALEAFDTLKSDDNYVDLAFIIQDDLNELDEISSTQANIDGQLAMIEELIDAQIDAVPIYEELLDKIDSETYISQAQKEKIKSLKKDLKALKDDSDSTSEKDSDDENDHEAEGETDESDDASDQADNDEDETTDNSDEGNDTSDSGTESADDAAYSLAYNYVIEQGIASKSMLDNGNVRLNMDHQDGNGAYIFQLFEVVSDGGSGHTATWGWYAVNVESGSVSEAY